MTTDDPAGPQVEGALQSGGSASPQGSNWGNLLDHRHANIFIDLEIGRIAMARGRVADADRHSSGICRFATGERSKSPHRTRPFPCLDKMPDPGDTGSGGGAAFSGD